MRCCGREWARIGVVMLASVALAMAPGFVSAQSQSGSDPASSESKPPGSGGTDAAKSAPVAKTTPTPGQIGDRLHNSAKNFGEALLDGMKYAGRKVGDFFKGDKTN